MNKLHKFDEIRADIVALVIKSLEECGVNLSTNLKLDHLKRIFAEANLIACCIRREQYLRIMRKWGHEVREPKMPVPMINLERDNYDSDSFILKPYQTHQD